MGGFMTGPGDKGQADSGWDAQWLDNVGRPWLIDFKTQFGDPRFELVQRWVHTKALDVFADLSWEQIAELRHNIAAILEYYVPSTGTASGTYGWSGTATGETPPERLTATVEAASPKLAADLHEQKWNRTEFIAALTLLLMLIQTMFQIYEDLQEHQQCGYRPYRGRAEVTVTTTAMAETTAARPRVRTRSLGSGSGANNAPSTSSRAAMRRVITLCVH